VGSAQQVDRSDGLQQVRCATGAQQRAAASLSGAVGAELSEGSEWGLIGVSSLPIMN
jgi:hypothetical protein